MWAQHVAQPGREALESHPARRFAFDLLRHRDAYLTVEIPYEVDGSCLIRDRPGRVDGPDDARPYGVERHEPRSHDLWSKLRFCTMPRISCAASRCRSVPARSKCP